MTNSKIKYGDWENDDLLLAETVLRYVRNGGVINDACKEVEEKLNYTRTFTTLKHRWFTVLKKQYEHAFNLALKEGKKKKKKRYRRSQNINADELGIIEALNVVKAYSEQIAKDKDERLKAEELKKENQAIKEKLNKINEEMEMITDMLKHERAKNNDLIKTIQTLNSIGFNLDDSRKKYSVDKQGVVEVPTR
ncbi:transcriptional regulator [Bacillus phage PBC4]|uniref:Putative RsfA family transcriptional regulator n=1 Tax=Bacillus phage PBC4 TaxID=1675028 RepID=A0A1D6X8E5_9CAUD|nr:transcriptional regulator [Bacillus phage PBC4]AKQ08312.1 putative RsfA family transcriptional regulator [Bacillus phage PBC4]WEM05642.1 transcriptional regulator [Bacillus phage BSG01]